MAIKYTNTAAAVDRAQAAKAEKLAADQAAQADVPVILEKPKKPRFDRNAYQRDLMRRRRADDKLGKQITARPQPPAS